MRQKCLAVGIILLFIGTAIIPSSAQNIEKSSSASRGHWLYVGGHGPGNYSTIGAAYFYASDGDTIFVYDGVYLGGITIAKTITLLGEVSHTVVEQTGAIFEITAPNVIIDRFTIIGGSDLWWNDAAVKVSSSGNKILNCTFLDNPQNGIFLGGSANENLIAWNVFQRQTHSIALEHSSNNTMLHNSFMAGGLYLYDNSENNTIAYNHFNGNNICINLDKCSKNLIENNSFHINTLGLKIWIGSGNLIQYNHFKSNKQGIYLLDAASNSIKANTFIWNKEHAFFDNGRNLWFNNFWGRPRLLPYLVWGQTDGMFPDNPRPTFQIDIHPRLLPLKAPV
jgi:parallel beta-helix repeat protein